ncbi:MAG: formylglycine-generating enzyme family protein, partial [Hyphomonadaceae bacterium]
CHEARYSTQPSDGSAFTKKSYCYGRMGRGGSWYETPNYLRSASRAVQDPLRVNTATGFRLARTLP